MTFTRPFWLALAVVAVVAIALATRSLERRRGARAFAYSNLAFALDALRPSRTANVAFFAAFVVATLALALAAGGPHVEARVPTHDGTVVLCIDTSGSMRSTDLVPSRAAAAKAAARAFVEAVPAGTRIGIVTFATNAMATLAPTADRDAVVSAIARISPPDGATAIGDALLLAGDALPPRGRRAIVLLTDGENNRGAEPATIARSLGARGVAIDTIGVGSSGSGQAIPGTSEPADLDEDGLRAIAADGNGHYVAASDAASLRDAFRGLALETVWERRRVDASFPFALGGGVLLVATLLAGLGAGRFP